MIVISAGLAEPDQPRSAGLPPSSELRHALSPRCERGRVCPTGRPPGRTRRSSEGREDFTGVSDNDRDVGITGGAADTERQTEGYDDSRTRRQG